MLLFFYTTTRKGFVIFTCRYFKLSWNTTALSQSNCRNFSCSSIKRVIRHLCHINGPLPSSKNSLLKWGQVHNLFFVKIIFICTRMKNHFHIKGWALNFVLIQRLGRTRKWPTGALGFNFFFFHPKPVLRANVCKNRSGRGDIILKKSPQIL